MTTLAPPRVDCEIVHPGIPVGDVAKAVKFYTEKLGFTLGFISGEPPTIAGVNLGRAQVFLEAAPPNPSGAAVYFVVDEVDDLYEFHRANGVEVVHAPRDMAYGMREYQVRDLNGYLLGFAHHLFDAGPKIEIERVAVPLRLEKRLAGLLADLAKHKRMSIDSCVEEMLLHTNEGVGPHTKRTLDVIQELKRKHGIDYDSHASYRFVER